MNDELSIGLLGIIAITINTILFLVLTGGIGWACIECFNDRNYFFSSMFAGIFIKFIISGSGLNGVFRSGDLNS